MLGTFAKIKMPMKCHRFGILFRRYGAKNEDQDICLLTHEVIKVMMDNFYEVGVCVCVGGGGVWEAYFFFILDVYNQP